MKPAVISSQPASGQRTDPQPASGGSESNFGPILQAAEQSAPVSPIRSNSNGSSRPGGSAPNARSAPKRDASQSGAGGNAGAGKGNDAATAANPPSAAKAAQNTASAGSSSPSSEDASTASTADASASNGTPAASAGASSSAALLDNSAQAGGTTGASDPTRADPLGAAQTQTAPAAADAAAADPASGWIAGQVLATGAQGSAKAATAKALPASSTNSGAGPAAATASVRGTAAGAQLQRAIALASGDSSATPTRAFGDAGHAAAVEAAGAGGQAAGLAGADADADADADPAVPDNAAAGAILSANAKIADAAALIGAAGSAQAQLAGPKLTDALSHAASPMQSVSADLSNSAPISVSSAGSYSAYSGATYAAEARTSVATPVDQPGFGQEFSERVLVLAHGGVQTAQISLQPSGLGPVGVSIQVNGHAATLAFTAQHEATRNALAAELPRLREMFAASGMQLSDATVGGREQPGWQASDPQNLARQPLLDGASDAAGTNVNGSDGLAVAPAAASTLRLVDTYA
ncbi:MAG: flagellar hook-length control protein FliK [Burkholderiaceae bacterium]|nr:flagellar hook-length control protein FliK [Burkholderiaceae bacterium]